MTDSNIIKKLKKHKKNSNKKRQIFLNSFAEKMIYRTTKGENLETSLAMVRKVLQKLATKL